MFMRKGQVGKINCEPSIEAACVPDLTQEISAVTILYTVTRSVALVRPESNYLYHFCKAGISVLLK